MKKSLLEIINYYGVSPQLKYFQSEVFELSEAIINYENAKTIFGKRNTLGNKHIAEEIADVLVMLNQFVEYYQIQDSDIYIIMEQKIDRQLERIKNDSKGNV